MPYKTIVNSYHVCCRRRLLLSTWPNTARSRASWKMPRRELMLLKTLSRNSGPRTAAQSHSLEPLPVVWPLWHVLSSHQRQHSKQIVWWVILLNLKMWHHFCGEFIYLFSVPSSASHILLIEPAHEILALFVLRKLILQTPMRSHPVGLNVWFFGRTLRLLPYFMCANSEGSGETARMRRLGWAFAGRLCDKYYNLMSWLISLFRRRLRDHLFLIIHELKCFSCWNFIFFPVFEELMFLGRNAKDSGTNITLL